MIDRGQRDPSNLVLEIISMGWMGGFVHTEEDVIVRLKEWTCRVWVFY